MQTSETTGLARIVAGLTNVERQLAIAILGLLAACGLAMAVAGRNDAFGLQGFIVLAFSASLAFVILASSGAPDPDPERTSRYYDEPTKAGIAQRAVGVPYTDAMIENAARDAFGQATPDHELSGGGSERYGDATHIRAFDGDGSRIPEMDAIVAYLQVLGRMTDAAYAQTSSVEQ